ncbi:VOC family protein [Pseudomonas sp. TE50-2]|uniref:VOC family protein n=1 Tax=Pseudomonas sp. TE50-2 TaxID=3142707 RepID=UPI0034652A35
MSEPDRLNTLALRRSTVDHLVIVSPPLPLGAQFVERQLGVRLQPGGAHTRMSRKPARIYSLTTQAGYPPMGRPRPIADI